MHFSSKKTIHLCFIHTLVGVKYNKTLKALLLVCMKYTALGEGSALSNIHMLL